MHTRSPESMTVATKRIVFPSPSPFHAILSTHLTSSYSNRVMNLSSNALGPVFSVNDNYDCRTRPWYIEGFNAADTGAWSSMYTYTMNGVDSNYLAFDAVRPMYDLRGNRIGVADVSITLDDLNEVVLSPPNATLTNQQPTNEVLFIATPPIALSEYAKYYDRIRRCICIFGGR